MPVWVYAFLLHLRKKGSEAEKEELEEEEDAGIGFQWAFPVVLHYSYSESMVQPTDILEVWEGIIFGKRQ